MANTTNLNLVKPAGTDYALVSVINGNMDIIDSKVGAIPANESAQSQITALNNQMSRKTSKTYVALTNGTAVDYIFPDNTAFILLIERGNSTSVGYSGLYIGYAHTNGHIVPVKESSSCTVSINGKTLTMTASGTNMEAHIITFSY